MLSGADEALISTHNDRLSWQDEDLKRECARLPAEVDFLRSALHQKTEEAHHWRTLYNRRHEQAQKLEKLLGLRDAQIAQLNQELAKKQAHIDKLEKKLFGPTSERDVLNAPASATTILENEQPAAAPATSGPVHSEPCRQPIKRRRGKQPGSPGFGPRHHDRLPVEEEKVYDVDGTCCPECGERYQEVCEEVSDTVEVSVRAYRRRHRRKKYGHVCKRTGRWLTTRGKGPSRLFPHSLYGISLWVFLLVGKFSLQIPVNRLLLMLAQKGLKLSPGTVTAGLRRILMLLRPLIREIKRYSREAKSHWHIDDTGWKTFVRIDGKEGFGWHLWVFKSDDVCVFILSPSRSRQVPKSHLQHSSGVVSCDRLQANRKLGDFLIYAFCWVHERRHLRQLFASYPELRTLCEEFLHLIGSLFYHNKERLLHEDGSAEQAQASDALAKTLSQILKRTQECLSDPDLHPELRRVLTGIKTDWQGLSTFFELPAIPPDNNEAERALRGPVVGRKNYYGSGSKWSAELAASMFTLNATLALNNISLEEFLTEYLGACAANGGRPPANAASFLPWNRKPPPPD